MTRLTNSRRRLLVLSAVVALVGLGCREEQAPLTRHPPAAATSSASVVRAQASGASSAQAVKAKTATAAPSGAPPNPRKKKLAAVERTWAWETSVVGPMRVVVSIPEHIEGAKLPVLVTMHGLGESRKGPEKGARGWLDDYALGRAGSRLRAPPITSQDLSGFGGPRLELFNQALAKQPFQDLIVVMPYTPDILKGDRPFHLAEPLAKFLVDELLPRVYKETPARRDPLGTGIDGVSLGGRAALLVGLLRPESFGAVGGLQPAFDSKDAPELTRRALTARRKNPKLQLRLLSSTQDFFLESTRAISRAFDAAEVDHSLIVVPGTHSYEFNRGPGAYELLLYHSRVLRGEPPI